MKILLKKALPVVVLVVIFAVAVAVSLFPSPGVELESTEPRSFATQHIKGTLPAGWELASALTQAGEGALRFQGPGGSVAIAYYTAVENVGDNADNTMAEIVAEIVQTIENSQGISLRGVSDMPVVGATAKRIDVAASENTRLLYIWLRQDVGSGMVFNVVAETPDSEQVASADALTASLEYQLLEAD